MFLCLCTCRHGAGDEFSKVLFFKRKNLIYYQSETVQPIDVLVNCAFVLKKKIASFLKVGRGNQNVRKYYFKKG